MMEEDTNIGLKMWISKTITTLLILLAVVYLVQLYFDVPILIDTILAITIAIAIGFTHEGLHYWQAVKLGYKPKWYRTKIMMGFEISHHTKRVVWLVHKKKIARAPYVVLVPVSLVILLAGIYFNQFGLMVGGIVGLLLHGVSWPLEGKDA